jgi:hypothetical protein
MLLFTIIQIFKETKLMRVSKYNAYSNCSIVRFTHLYVGARWFLVMHHGVMRMKRLFMSRGRLCFFGLAFDIKSKLTSFRCVYRYYFICSLHELIDPVLIYSPFNSYWLMIHVAVIVASYG